MARKQQVKLDPARIEAEAQASKEAEEAALIAMIKAEEDAKAAEALPVPPPVVIIPDAPPESLEKPPVADPAGAPPVPVAAIPQAAPVNPPPPAPKPAPKPAPAPYVQKRYRVTEDRRFALNGMTQNWRAGRMLDSNGYDITYLRSIGVKMVEV
jgi:hypothetical protein